MNFGVKSKKWTKFVAILMALVLSTSTMVTGFATTIDISMKQPAGVEEYLASKGSENGSVVETTGNAVTISENESEVGGVVEPSVLLGSSNGSISIDYGSNSVADVMSYNSPILNRKVLISTKGSGVIGIVPEFLATGDPWENLTYKGGIAEYLRRLNTEVVVIGVPNTQKSVYVDGYIIGTPWVPQQTQTQTPPVETPPPVEQPVETPPPADPVPEQPVETPAEPGVQSLSETDQANIKKAVQNVMKYAVSAREASNAKMYVYSAQAGEVDQFVTNKNSAIVQLDQNSVAANGISAINNMMGQFVVASKLNVESIDVLDASIPEYNVTVSVPVISKFATMPEDVKKALGANYDLTNVANLDKILSNPVDSKNSVDAVFYDKVMQTMHDFYNAYGTTDLYNAYGSTDMYGKGTMTLRMKQENGNWVIDKNSMTVHCTIDGVAGQVTFYK